MSQPPVPLQPFRIPWWQWPHVLSLEAPIVAVLWQAAVAHLHGVILLPGVTAGLALVVWLIYLLDRTLDTVGVPLEHLDLRHSFYLRYRWLILGIALPAGTVIAAWLALWVVPSGLMWHCIALALLVAIYLSAYAVPVARTGHVVAVIIAGFGVLLAVSKLPLAETPKFAISVLIVALMALLCLRQFHDRFSGLFPKELAAGILFAFGCVAAIRFLDLGGDMVPNLFETILLSMLFTANLTCISAREAEEGLIPPFSGSSSIHRLNHNVLRNTLLLAAVGVFLGLTSLPPRTAVSAAAVAVGILLLYILQSQRRHYSSDLFRVLADVAVAVPVVLLFWLG